MRPITLAIVLCVSAPLFAQRGDRAGHVMTENWRTMKLPGSEPRTPQEELATFKIKPGFRVELVAGEPMIESPVAMQFDERGRLWVVEMRGYMPNIDGTGEADLKTGRVSILEDLDGDGRMDKVTRFLEGLVMPRAIAFVEGGVLVAEPPSLYYCRDADGDDVCDSKVKLTDYAQVEPVEVTENGLMWGLDNWLYSAKSGRKFRFKDGKLITANSQFHGQWGITQDDFGRIFINSNDRPVMACFYPTDYLLRNPAIATMRGDSVAIADTEVYPIRPTPGVNRGYMEGILKPDGSLANFTAACSLLVYRGDQFPPEFQGNIFIPEPAGNLLKRQILTEKPGSIELQSSNAYPDSEFLASTDERFRPTMAVNAPDGCLYLVDLYRGILQHKLYMTTYLRTQVVERKLDQHINLGRIWRIVPEGKKIPRPADLSKAAPAELVNALNSPNGWTRDTAQRLLVTRGDSSAAPALRELAIKAADPRAKIHAMWTLDGLGAMDAAAAEASLKNEHPKVAQAALRASEPLLGNQDLFFNAVNVATRHDPAIRLQGALSVGGMTRDQNVGKYALDLMRQFFEFDVSDVYLRSAILSGCDHLEVRLLVSMLDKPQWDCLYDKNRAAILTEIAAAAYRHADPALTAPLLELIAAQTGEKAWRGAAMLAGVLDATKKVKKIKLAAEPPLLARLAGSKDAKVRAQGATLAKALSWPGKIGDVAVKKMELDSAQKALIEKGRAVYMGLCFACHQVNGMGLTGVAPPLVDSPYVLGSDKALIRIVLHGIGGPIKIDGAKWDLVMPGLKDSPLMTDQAIAAVLSYIRQEWDHNAAPIDPATVTQIRAQTRDRIEYWKAEELEKLQ